MKLVEVWQLVAAKLHATVTIPGTVEVVQDTATDLHVSIDSHENRWRFGTLTHGDLIDVWTPGGGNTLHLVAMIVSVEAAGTVNIYQGALEFVRMHFNEKKTVPLPIVMDLVFTADDVLKAKYTGDAGAPTGYMTAIGHEY